jgi:alpha-1,3-rhamnosyltransferase
MLTVAENTGIPANCNRGLNASEGEWIKFIAGDDILSDQCIQLNVNYVKDRGYPEIIVVSDLVRFNDSSKINERNIVPPKNTFILKEGMSPSIQYEYLLYSFFSNTPSLFFSKRILVNINFDERFPYIEDYPFALNATKHGYSFQYLNNVTCYYRISNESVSTSKKNNILFNDFYLKIRPFQLIYIYPNISKLTRIIYNIEYYRFKLMDILGLNKSTFFGKCIIVMSSKLTPYVGYKRFKVKQILKRV